LGKGEEEELPVNTEKTKRSASMMKSQRLEHVSGNSAESGQGILEYSVIIVLVVIIIISFVALFGVDLFNRFISNRARASEEQSIQATPEPVVNLFETGTQLEVQKTETIRIENCPSSEPYNPEIERKLWLEYDIEFLGQFPASLRPKSIISVQAYYGFTTGGREERTFSLNLEAPPNSMVDYTIEWQRVWKDGDIQIAQSDDSQHAFGYRACVDLDYEITQIEQRTCESIPYP
jgi:hypothetical protein